MFIHNLVGVIRRRILVNFRVDPAIMQRQLPSHFRPKLVADAALAGICLIRLEHLRLRSLPPALGMSSENAAHRVAVRWSAPDGSEQEGVYIPRRDSGSCFNHLVGGRIFPGEHQRAQFRVRDENGHIDLSMRSLDGSVAVELRAKSSTGLPPTSRFRSLAEASQFFEHGSLGYSETRNRGRLDGLRLVTNDWRIEALEVEHVHSSLFSDASLFPKGSVEFDCALLMRDIEHEWRPAPELMSGKPSLGDTAQRSAAMGSKRAACGSSG
jgi:hypothetical protein